LIGADELNPKEEESKVGKKDKKEKKKMPKPRSTST
jgi:hypothetical protein